MLAELGERINSIVLFGSVARGEATSESDIDVLVITDAPFGVRERIREVAYDIILADEVLIQLVIFTSTDLEEEARLRSYFFHYLMNEGIILHDDGLFKGFRERVAKAGPGVPRR